jgi:hypothetical protein
VSRAGRDGFERLYRENNPEAIAIDLLPQGQFQPFLASQDMHERSIGKTAAGGDKSAPKFKEIRDIFH